jgi:NADH:ubiquinone oxidoreductase subunit C
VETADLKKLIERLVPDSLLQCVNFGRTNEGCAWIEISSLENLARALRFDSGLEFDWLENLSAMQMDEVIVLTYFLSSRSGGLTCRLRSSVGIEDADKPVPFPSVATVWPSAEVFEREIAEMFGVSFLGAPERGNESPWSEKGTLPPGFQGYPLRKTFSLNVAITTPDVGSIE